MCTILAIFLHHPSVPRGVGVLILVSGTGNGDAFQSLQIDKFDALFATHFMNNNNKMKRGCES